VSQSSSSVPPGWYHGEGDPAGTVRYWEGSQWVGGPVTPPPVQAGSGRHWDGSRWVEGSGAPSATTQQATGNGRYWDGSRWVDYGATVTHAANESSPADRERGRETELESPADGRGKPLYRVGASYEGGHPRFVAKEGRGDLIVWPDRVEFVSGALRFSIPVVDIIGVELGEMQFGLVRSIVGSEARAIQTQTPMVLLSCNINRAAQTLRFHVHGAATIPGESKNARKFLDHLNALKSKFVNDLAPSAARAAAEIDAIERLEKLAQLHSTGVVTTAEFERLKSELLSGR
jgi:hypothetical protein